jgi:hypothetical protein
MSVMEQHGATIVKTIIRDHVDALKALLQHIDVAMPDSELIPFPKFGSLHFMSWVIVDGDCEEPQLFMEINVDGPIKTFLYELIRTAGPGIDAIYGHCSGYPTRGAAAPDGVVNYWLADDQGYDCYYVGWRGYTVLQIQQERDLRCRFEQTLNKEDPQTLAAMSPTAVRTLLQGVVNDDASLAWVRDASLRPFFVRNRALVLGGLFTLGVLLLVALGLGIWHEGGSGPLLTTVEIAAGLVFLLAAWLLGHELTDSVSDIQPNHERVADVVSQENRVVQNHLASVALVKPGIFRWIILKSVLKLIHVLAAISYNQGSLSGIPSIHFARWLIIDQGRRLLFLSNYDGSWENYLDDFIDQASNGLTAIWSNTVGFPRSWLLVNGGARDELLFKAMVRESQTPSRVWYSAYPDLSNQNIRANAAIRAGLFARMTADAEAVWLKNL